MRQIKTILLSLVLLLGVACTSTATEPSVPTAAPVMEDVAPVEKPTTVPAEDTSVAMPETAVNEQAAKPQFIMFTASW